MTEISKQAEEAVAYLKKRGAGTPELAIILGTGLGQLTGHIEVHQEFNYKDIPNFPIATVEFHKGKLLFGKLAGKEVMVMQGRFHYYEGYNMQQIALPVYVMKKMGVRTLLVSNACGSMNTDFKKGELMLITDHINLFADNPLIGKNDDDAGPRFPDMSQAYAVRINKLITESALSLDIKLRQGVYCALSGPNMETAAEYRYLRFIGADVVGMSTVPEVTTANHIGLPVAAVSVITDECDPDNLEPINIDDILETAARAEVDLIRLFKSVVARLD